MNDGTPTWLQENLTDINKDVSKWDKFFFNFFRLDTIAEKTFLLLHGLVLLALWYNLQHLNANVQGKIVETTCWPFFQSCSYLQNLFFLNFNTSYRGIYFSVLMFLLTVAFISLLKKKFGISMLLGCIVALSSIVPMFILTDNYNVVIHHQEHYLFYIVLIYFLARHSRIQLLITFFFLTYFFSAIPKFTSEFWLLGLIDVPFLSPLVEPFAQNLIILSQLILPLLILFGKKYVRYLSVLFFELFHFYSMIILEVRYTFFWVTIPFVYLLFVEFYERVTINTFKKNYLSVLVLLIFIFLSLVRFIIPGNDQITMEGSGYALNMFNVTYRYNTVRYEVSKHGVKSEPIELTSYYSYLSQLKKNCHDGLPKALHVTLGTVYNRYATVDVPDYCVLEYKPFSKNSWIHDPPLAYGENLNMLNEVQRIFHSVKDELQLFYYLIFFMGSFLTIYKIFIEGNE